MAGEHSSGGSGRSPWLYFNSGIGPVLFSAGLALWTNTLIEARYSKSLEREKIKERLEERITEKHEAYSKCMRAIISWNRTYGEQAGEVFEKRLDLAGVGKLEPALSAQVERVNECRSLTKDFWRLTISYLDKFPESNKDTADMKERHDRFVKQVKPLDILYSSQTNGRTEHVYIFPESTP